MRALILVDIQNDFCPGGALEIKHGDAVVPVANALLGRFEHVIATQDSHPPDHESFSANNAGTKVYDVIDLHGLPQVMWPVHCVTGTPGWQFHPQLEIARVPTVIAKGTDRAIDSYSGFFDNGHRKATGLEVALRSRNVSEVYVLGLATDYCVKATALDAQNLGFKTHLVADGCRAVNLQVGDDEAATREMRDAGITICQSSELLREGRP